MTAALRHQIERMAAGNRKSTKVDSKFIFIHTIRREALRSSLLALTVLAGVLLSNSVASAYQADQVEQLTQQQVDQESFAFSYGADNDQSLIPVQQQQLNGNFGSRPVRPDFSTFGLRPTTSTTTEPTLQQQDQQQQSEDSEQQQQQQQTGSSQQEGQQQIVQQNNLDGEDEQTSTQAPSTTRKPLRPIGVAGQQQLRPNGQRPTASRPRTTSTTTTTTEQPNQVSQGEDDNSQASQTGNGDNSNTLDNGNDGQQQQEENNSDVTGNQGASTRSPLTPSQGRPINSGSNSGLTPTNDSAGRPKGVRPVTDGTVSQQPQEEQQQFVDGESDQESGTSSQDTSSNNENDDNTTNNGSTSNDENSQQQQIDAKPATSTRGPSQRPVSTRAPISSTTVTTTTSLPVISQQNGQQEVDGQFEGGNNNQEDNLDSTGQQQQQQDDSGNGAQDVSTQAPTTTTTTTRAPVQAAKSGSRPRGQNVPLKGKPVATPMNFVNQQRLQNSQLTNGVSGEIPTRPSGQKGSSKPVKGNRRPTLTSGVNSQSGFGNPSQQQQLTNEGQDQQQVTPSKNGNPQSGRQTTESPIVQQNNLSGEEESQTGNEQPSIPSSRPSPTGLSRPQGTSNGSSNQQRPLGSRPNGSRPRTTSTTTTTTTTTTEQPIQVVQGDDDSSQGTQTGNGDGENTSTLENNNNNNNNEDNQEQQQQQEEKDSADSSTRAPSSGSESGLKPVSGSNTLGGTTNNQSLGGADSSLNRPNAGRPVSQQQQEELQQIVNGGDSDSETSSQDSGNGSSDGDEATSGNATGTSGDDEEQQKVDIVSTSTTTTRRPFNQRPIFSQRPSASTTTTTTTTTTTPAPISQQIGLDNQGQFEQNNNQENTNGSGTESQENGDENENGSGFSSQQSSSTTTTTQAPTTSAATTRKPVTGQQAKGNLIKPRPVASSVTGQRAVAGPTSVGKSSGSRTSTQQVGPTSTLSTSVLGENKGSSRPLSQETFGVQPAIGSQQIGSGPLIQRFQAKAPESFVQQQGQISVDGDVNDMFNQQQLHAVQPSQGPRFVMVPMAMRQQILDFAQQQNLIPPQAPIFLGPQISEQQQIVQQQIMQQQLMSSPVVEPTFKSRPPKPIMGGSFQQQSTKSANRPSVVSVPSRFGVQQVSIGGSPAGIANGGSSSTQGTKQQGPRRLSWMTNLLPSNQASRQPANQQQAIKQTLTPFSQSRQPSSGSQSSGARTGTKQQQQSIFPSVGQQQTQTSTNELPVSSGIQSQTRAAKTQQAQLQESRTANPISSGQQTGTSNAHKGLARAGTIGGSKGRRPVVSQSSTGTQLKPTTGSSSGQLVSEQRQPQQIQLVTGIGNGPSVVAKGSSRSLRPVVSGQQVVSPASASRATKTQSTATGVSQLQQQQQQQQLNPSDTFQPSVIPTETSSSGLSNSENSESQQSNNGGFSQRGPIASAQQVGATKGGRSNPIKLANGLSSPRAQAARMSPGAKSRLATKNLLAQQQLLIN